MDQTSPPQVPAAPAPADPGTPFSRAVTLVLAVVLTAAVVVLQNMPVAAPEVAREELPEVFPPQLGAPSNTIGRMFVKMSDMVREDPSAMSTLDRFVVDDADRVRAAIVAGEVVGDEEAEARLEALLATLDPDSALAQDAADLLLIYGAEDHEGDDDGDEDGGEEGEAVAAISPETADRLETHHGFFGEVATTHHLDRDHPDRAALVEGGVAMMALMSGVTLLLIGAFVVGFGLFLTAVLLLVMGKLRRRMPRPTAGGSVYLEVFVLFVGGFLAFKLIAEGVSKAMPDAAWVGVATLLGQWLLLLAVLWPLVRGVRWADLRTAMGWRAPTGIFREIAFGVLGYLAGLPLYAIGIAITFLLVALGSLFGGDSEPALPSQNLFEIVGGSSVLGLLLFVSLATLWAPLCEESVFRGALYRHMRARVAIPVAAIGSALLFAFMHGYGPIFVFPLIALGAVFALMREWRGSLVAPITAHFLHNATVTVLLVVMLRVLN